MKQNNIIKKIKNILLIIPFLFLITSTSAEKIQDFNPEDVMPKDCKNGNFKCGYVPASKAEMETIPESSSNFIRHRGLPSRVDLSSKMPPIGNQGSQGSCVAWSTTYAVKSYNEKVKHGWNYDLTWKKRKVAIPGRTGWYRWEYYPEGKLEHIFSPAWTYNQINGGRDNGSVISYATRLLVQKGATPWKYMPYNAKNYTKQPSYNAKTQAKKYRSERFERLSFSSPEPIKAELAKGHPVIVGITIYQNFYKLGSKVYDSFSGRALGGHAIALIGYDDNKRSSHGHKGAFKIMNSWGPNWGTNGFGWISYRHLARANHTAIVLYEKAGSKPVVDDDKDNKIIVKVKAPRSVTASRGVYSNKIVVAWSSVKGALSYKIQRKKPYSSTYYQIAFANKNQFIDTNITPGGAYRYRIIAVGEDNSSKAENSPIAEGYSIKKKTKKIPLKVADLSAQVYTTMNKNTVKLTWSKAMDAKYYELQRWNVKKYKWNIVTSYTRTTSYIDRFPFAGKINYYRVRGKNFKGKGAFSNTVSILVAGKRTPPAKVTGLKASVGSYKGKIVVNWKKSANASKYYVYRYDYRRRKWDTPIVTKKTFYSDTASKLGTGNWYAYTVIASNKYGYSDFSNSVYGRARSFSQRGVTLKAPKKVKATIDKNKKTITLTWKKIKGAKSYYVFRKTENSKFKFLKEIAKTTFTEKIKKEEKLYFYTVRSKSMFGESANSNIVVGFINSTMPGMRERFIPGDGIKNFTGTWTSSYWTNKVKRPVKIILNITGKDNKFKISLKVGSKKAKTVHGIYASKSNYLEVPGFSMKIPMNVEDVADVEVTKKLSPYEFISTFTRESK